MKSQPHLTIRPSGRFERIDFKELSLYRDLFVTLGLRDVTLRYRQTALGVIWVVFQPLLAAVIFSTVFGRIAHMPSDGMNYFVYAFAGLTAWNLFNSILSRGGMSLVDNANLVSKVYFPRIILPFSTAFAASLDFCVSFIVLLIIMATHRVYPTIAILTVPFWYCMIVMFAGSLALFIASVVVSYRDVQFMVPVLLPFLMYASPVAYSISKVPHRLLSIIALNPMVGLLEVFRWSVFGHSPVVWWHVIYSVLVTVVLLSISMINFQRTQRRFADVI